MTEILYESDADQGALHGQTVCVVGYGNQGRSWALNLRDSGLDVTVAVRADTSRDQAGADGFDAVGIDRAGGFDVCCLLVPDDVIPELGIERRADSLTVVASGYWLAFDRLRVEGDVVMIAPRMLAVGRFDHAGLARGDPIRRVRGRMGRGTRLGPPDPCRAARGERRARHGRLRAEHPHPLRT